MRDGRTGGADCREEDHLEGPLPVSVGDLEKTVRAGVDAADVVDQQVDAAETRYRLVDERLAADCGREVVQDDEYVAFVGEIAQFRGAVQCACGDRRALPDEGARDFQPDTPAGSRHDGGLAGEVQVHSPCSFSQRRHVSAISAQPESMVRECPRSGKVLMSVVAVEWRYCLSVARVIDSGTVLSFPLAISSSGPRFALSVSTLAAECGLKLAPAASKSGRPGA